jgi:hypothetical protein
VKQVEREILSLPIRDCLVAEGDPKISRSFEPSGRTGSLFLVSRKPLFLPIPFERGVQYFPVGTIIQR